MSQNITSKNPAVLAVISGQVPQQARMAAARGMLPLPQADLLEILVALTRDEDAELAAAAQETLQTQEPDDLLSAAQAVEAAPAVLGYLAGRKDLPLAVYEAVAQNKATPDEAVALMARQTADGSLIELLIINQQRLIRAPSIIDAVLVNPARTPEAERRVKEVQEEFFQKERGAQQRIAEELRAEGSLLFTDKDFKDAPSLAQRLLARQDAVSAHLYAQFAGAARGALAQVANAEALLKALKEEFNLAIQGPSLHALKLFALVKLLPETIELLEQRPIKDELVRLNRLLLEDAYPKELAKNPLSIAQRMLKMKIKQRVKFAMKGDREARSILIRDSNKIVSGAVIRNPKITAQEIEAIAAMRSVSDEALRLIGMSRAWAQNYSIIHALARNPRTPVAIAMGILPRLHTRDLRQLANSRNITEGIRRQANRLAMTRKN